MNRCQSWPPTEQEGYDGIEEMFSDLCDWHCSGNHQLWVGCVWGISRLIEVMSSALTQLEKMEGWKM